MKKVVLGICLAACFSGVTFASVESAALAEHHRSGNGHYPVSDIVIQGENGGQVVCTWHEAKLANQSSGWQCRGDDIQVQSVSFEDSNGGGVFCPVKTLDEKRYTQCTLITAERKIPAQPAPDNR